jgi:ADP-ribose pyrophosphatase
MSKAPFQTLSSKVVYENRWMRVIADEVEKIADGHRFPYAYLSVQDSVMVVAVTPLRQLLLIRQYRYPTRRYSWELPGGGSGGLEPVEAARKELQEETGYSAGRLEKVGEFVTYCGLADEICHVVLADELVQGPQRLERSEDITVRAVDRVELEGMIRRGELNDGMGLAALGVVRERLEQILTAGG